MKAKKAIPQQPMSLRQRIIRDHTSAFNTLAARTEETLCAQRRTQLNMLINQMDLEDLNFMLVVAENVL